MKPERDWIGGWIISFGRIDIEKDEYFVDPDTQSWVRETCAFAFRNRKYLNERGFGDHDLAALAEAQPLAEHPPKSGVTKAEHENDPRPRADVVSAARSFLLAEELRSAYESRDLNLALDCAFKLGISNLATCMLQMSPGQKAEKADDLREMMLSLGIERDKNELEKEHARLKRRIGLRAAIRKTTEDRNKLLCQTAERLRAENNVADRNLASMTWKTWCSQGYWERFSYKEISDKQVRQVLRNGGVLTTVKPRKGRELSHFPNKTETT